MATREKMVELKGGGEALTAENVRARIAAYRRQITEYLDSIEANVESYKFSVEKSGDGLLIDVAVRASVHPRNRSGISK